MNKAWIKPFIISLILFFTGLMIEISINEVLPVTLKVGLFSFIFFIIANVATVEALVNSKDEDITRGGYIKLDGKTK